MGKSLSIGVLILALLFGGTISAQAGVLRPPAQVFERANLLTGSAVTSVPLFNLLAGDLGLELYLSYDSANTGFSWVGEGWSLGLPQIVDTGKAKYLNTPLGSFEFAKGTDGWLLNDLSRATETVNGWKLVAADGSLVTLFGNLVTTGSSKVYNVTKIRDAHDASIEVSYESDGYLTEIFMPDYRRLVFESEVNKQARLLQRIRFLGGNIERVYKFEYQGTKDHPLLTRITLLGKTKELAVVSFEYNTQNLLTKEILPYGGHFAYEYSGQLLKKLKVFAGSSEDNFDYEFADKKGSYYQRAKIKTAVGDINFTLNANPGLGLGQILSESYSDQSGKSASRSSVVYQTVKFAGADLVLPKEVKKEEGGQNVETTSISYTNGLPTKIVVASPKEGVSEKTLDYVSGPSVRIARERIKLDSLFSDVQFTWNDKGKLIKVADGENVGSMSYDNLGRLVHLETGGEKQNLFYDPTLKFAVIKIIQNGKTILERSYLPDGLLAKQTQEGEKEQSFEYDELGSLVRAKIGDDELEFEQEIGPFNTTLLVYVNSPDGNKDLVEFYDGLGRLVEVQRAGSPEVAYKLEWANLNRVANISYNPAVEFGGPSPGGTLIGDFTYGASPAGGLTGFSGLTYAQVKDLDGSIEPEEERGLPRFVVWIFIGLGVLVGLLIIFLVIRVLSKKSKKLPSSSVPPRIRPPVSPVSTVLPIPMSPPRPSIPPAPVAPPIKPPVPPSPPLPRQ